MDKHEIAMRLITRLKDTPNEFELTAIGRLIDEKYKLEYLIYNFASFVEEPYRVDFDECDTKGLWNAFCDWKEYKLVEHFNREEDTLVEKGVIDLDTMNKMLGTDCEEVKDGQR